MFTPLESTFGGSKSLNGEQSLRSELRLQSIERIVSINRDAFTIGSSKQCDLSIEDGSLPTLHSVIHVQNGAIWIEAADDTTKVTVNDRSYRRMALRHDDRLKLGTEEFRILMNAEPIANTGSATLQEDLSLLSAEELCDRIIAEQSMVADFVSGQSSGWDALLRAIEEADTEALPEAARVEIAEAETVAPEQEDVIAEPASIISDAAIAEEAALGSLLVEIQTLNESITEKTIELSEREKQVLETNSLLEESQKQVTERIDELLEQLNQAEPSTDLRASA